MRLVGVTQRYDSIENRDEYRDGLDVRWAKLLWDASILCIPLCSSIVKHQEYFDHLKLDGFILSGGNDIGDILSRDALEKSILEYSVNSGLPVLGVCRGMQFINQYQNGYHVEVEGHVSTRHRLIEENENFGGPTRIVNSFHKYGIKESTLGQDLDVLAFTADGVIESFRHKTYKWLGLMWHPERDFENNTDRTIIENFFNED